MLLNNNANQGNFKQAEQQNKAKIISMKSADHSQISSVGKKKLINKQPKASQKGVTGNNDSQR